MQVNSIKVTVTTAGTPVRVTTDDSIVANRIMVSGLPDNSGLAYFGNALLNTTSLAGLINGPLAAKVQTELIDHPGSNGFRLSDFWVDAAVNGEGALVTYYTV